MADAPPPPPSGASKPPPLAKPPPPLPKPPLLDLSQILSKPPRPEFEGRWYTGRKIVLDGNTYRNCRFDGCEITTSNGDIELVGCVISTDCRILFGNYALRVLGLANYDNAFAFADSLNPERLPNGR